MCEALAPAPTHSPQNFATGTSSREGPRTSPQHQPLGCPRRRAQAALLRRPGADRPAAVPVQRPEVHRPLRSPAGPLSRPPEAGRYSRVMAKRSGRAAPRRRCCHRQNNTLQLPQPPAAPLPPLPLIKPPWRLTSSRRAGGGTSTNGRAQSAHCALPREARGRGQQRARRSLRGRGVPTLRAAGAVRAVMAARQRGACHHSPGAPVGKHQGGCGVGAVSGHGELWNHRIILVGRDR